MSAVPPNIVSSEELSSAEARWVTLKKIKYRDQEGRERVWEAAARKTRGTSGVDAVAVLAILQPADKSPPATVIIEQFRPPVEKYVIELPAGLVDEGETVADAAVRELREETGLAAAGVVECSPLMVSDPGMTTANMQLVVLRVPVADARAFAHLSAQALEPGEFIVRRVVLLDALRQELNAYSERGFVVDARLSHFAIGYDTAQRLARGESL